MSQAEPGRRRTKVSVLYFQGCPNHRPTVEMVRATVRELELDVEVEEVELTGTDEVERLRFLGSPTVQVDGVDIDPAARGRTDYAMACRLYRTPDGLPSREMLLAALGVVGPGSGSEPAVRAQVGDCCCPEGETSVSRVAARPAGGSGSLIATGGSVAAAVLSSACCWLPMLLLAAGASAGGVGAVLSAWRWVFVTAAVALLAVSFYLTFVRRPVASCCGGGAWRSGRVRRGIWWVSAMAVAAFVFFPQIAGAALGGAQRERRPASEAGGQEFIFRIEGMHCEACATRLDSLLSELKGVQEARTDYPSGIARVHAADAQVVPLVLEAARRAGYSATLAGDAP